MSTILVVDDHAANRYLLRALLTGEGHDVAEAADGREALRLAHAQPPDLVVADLLMPVMDGFSLLRHWRYEERLRAIPFLVYTATYTSLRDERLALALGADAFLVKPAEPEVLGAVIRELLAQETHVERPPHDERTLVLEHHAVVAAKLEQKVAEAEALSRQLLEEARQRELRDRALHEVRLGIVISDARRPDLPMVYVSPGFERITGHAAAEVLGRNCRFLQGPDTDPDHVAQMRTALRAGVACSVELRNYRKDGTPFWNAVTINPVHDGTGQITHFVGVLDDVTERRRLEDQLRQAQKMEAVGRLAGGVAHDFNNMLTVICGSADLLRRRPHLSDEDRGVVAEIALAADRATSLTRQLLGFSRQALLHPRVVDLNAAVTETSRMLARLLGEDIRLEARPNAAPADVFVDLGHLNQILMNLAVNARDAMPRGGSLTIETATVSLPEEMVTIPLGGKSGPHVMLAVTDTGTGMSPEVQSHIFEPFFTTKPADRGTGLGLSVVFGIVQQSGGRLQVDSEVGRGTTFRIYLPLANASAPPELDVAELASEGHETILLVEDEPAVRELAAMALSLNGYTVLPAKDAPEAQAVMATRGGRVDLVLTDVVMPGMGGPELVDRLRLVAPNIKVLYMSGYTDDAVIRHGLLTGEVEFIQKPYTSLDLARKVRSVLDARS